MEEEKRLEFNFFLDSINLDERIGQRAIQIIYIYIKFLEKCLEKETMNSISKFDKWNYVQSIEWNWHLFPALLKDRASILKDPDGEDGVTDKKGTKRHARWALAVFSVARSTPKSAELRWVETADEPCTWPQFVLSIYTSWNVPATFARQTARCSISNTLRKRGERDPQTVPVCLTIITCTVKIYMYIHIK